MSPACRGAQRIVLQTQLLTTNKSLLLTMTFPHPQLSKTYMSRRDDFKVRGRADAASVLRCQITMKAIRTPPRVVVSNTVKDYFGMSSNEIAATIGFITVIPSCESGNTPSCCDATKSPYLCAGGANTVDQLQPRPQQPRPNLPPIPSIPKLCATTDLRPD